MGKEVSGIIRKNFTGEVIEGIERRLTHKLKQLTNRQGMHKFEDLNKEMRSSIEEEFNRAHSEAMNNFDSYCQGKEIKEEEIEKRHL